MYGLYGYGCGLGLALPAYSYGCGARYFWQIISNLNLNFFNFIDPVTCYQVNQHRGLNKQKNLKNEQKEQMENFFY